MTPGDPPRGYAAPDDDDLRQMLELVNEMAEQNAAGIVGINAANDAGG